ncbi:MAG: hypothetical protein ACRENF_06935 [Thermodesulfobacteriota bacterium]
MEGFLKTEELVFYEGKTNGRDKGRRGLIQQRNFMTPHMAKRTPMGRNILAWVRIVAKRGFYTQQMKRGG